MRNGCRGSEEVTSLDCTVVTELGKEARLSAGGLLDAHSYMAARSGSCRLSFAAECSKEARLSAGGLFGYKSI